MKRFKTGLSLVTLGSLFVACNALAQSQSQLAVADDSSSGTFKAVLADIIGVCSTDQFSIVEAKGVTGGAPGNLDAIVTNKAAAGFVDSDVYFVMEQSDPTYKRIKTLVSLYPDPIHVLALAQSLTKLHYVETVQFNSLVDARGYKVGAAGGGVYTARLLTGQGQGGFNVVEFPHGDDVINALNSGGISLAIFVGAAPLPNLEKLNQANPGKYKLIPIGEAIASNLKGVYKDVKINYTGMTRGPVATLAPWAEILTRQFSTAEKTTAQKNFRACFYKNLPQLQDNASPVWQQVDPNDRGVIDYLDLK